MITAYPINFISGEGGGGGITFPTFTMSENPLDPEDAIWSTTSTYAEVKATYNEYKLDITMPIIFVNNFADETTWTTCVFVDDISGEHVYPEGVTEGFEISAGAVFFANDGNFYPFY